MYLCNRNQLKQEVTHGEGYLRRFFNTIKGAANTLRGRIFVTGVSPVTMDDLTSGFNIVRESIKTTKLHKLVVIYRGAEMVACEEADI